MQNTKKKHFNYLIVASIIIDHVISSINDDIPMQTQSHKLRYERLNEFRNKKYELSANKHKATKAWSHEQSNIQTSEF